MWVFAICGAPAEQQKRMLASRDRARSQMHSSSALITCIHAFAYPQGDGRYVISNSKDQSIKL